MTAISAVDSGLFRTQESVQQQQAPKESELGQGEFLTLMLTQIKNQDPFKPMENGDFLAQMAQFSTVSGITEMQGSLENMAAGFQSSQVLQASSLVGKSVLVPADEYQFEQGDTLNGAVSLPTFAQGVTVEYFDPNGGLVAKQNLGTQQPGLVEFTFNGLDSEGKPIDNQSLIIKASFFNGQDQESVLTMVESRVDSVSLSASGGASLSIDRVGNKELSQIVAIKDDA
ncbi:MAG: hypothetical protein KAG18_06310 [Sinobacterium sp.]|nr:hypothetical protein [Sinobacterium sp.]